MTKRQPSEATLKTRAARDYFNAQAQHVSAKAAKAKADARLADAEAALKKAQEDCARLGVNVT